MNMHKLFYLFASFLAIEVALGQDVHFSQFPASPNYLNPALTGQYTGDWQAGNIYRDQWRSVSKPFVSDNFFFDRHFYYYSQEFSAALLAMHDASGPANLSGTRVYLSLAVPLKMGRSLVSVGLQPGIVWKYFNRDQLSYPNQFDQNTGYFNSSRTNNDPLATGSQKMQYFDFNLGIFWKLKLPNMTPEFGIALHHLNRPSESFYGYKNPIGVRQSVHGGINFRLSKMRYLKPAFWYTGMQRTNMMVIGTNFGKLVADEKSAIKEVFAGLYYRHGYQRNEDAIIPQIGAQYHRWRIGLSYDYNISGLKVATETRGAYELSVIYTAISTLPKKSSIPCERY